MKMYRFLLCLLLASTVSVMNGHAAERIVRMSDRQEVEFARMIADIGSARVIFLGETHDEAKHHEMQLDVLRALAAKRVPLALGLEMFSTESQPQLDRWVDGSLDEQSFRRVFAGSWTADFSLYREIFVFARDHHIPLVALNIPKEIVFKVSARGFASLRAEEKKGLPPDVSCVLTTPYTDFLRRVYSMHSGNDKSFTHFCEAQTLRNSGMAWNIAGYLKAHPGKTMLVLTGAWHAVKAGIPEQLPRYGGPSSMVILPELPGFSINDASSQDADFFIGQ